MYSTQGLFIAGAWRSASDGATMPVHSPVTEAVIGTEAVNALKLYNFTKGFFGTNGISTGSGFSTPDDSEGLVKRSALERASHADRSTAGSLKTSRLHDAGGFDDRRGAKALSSIMAANKRGSNS